MREVGSGLKSRDASGNDVCRLVDMGTGQFTVGRALLRAGRGEEVVV